MYLHVHFTKKKVPDTSSKRPSSQLSSQRVTLSKKRVNLKPLLHYAGNLLATWWQKMVAGDCHHIFTPIIFYWIKFVQCIFYIEDIVNKYLLTHLLPPVANGRQYVASKISASVNGALQTLVCHEGQVRIFNDIGCIQTITTLSIANEIKNYLIWR